MKPKLSLLLLLIANILFAQLTISGTVKNEKGQPIAGANVILSPSDADITLAYFITKADGKFTLTLKETSHELYEVKVRALNYAFTSDLVNESTSNFDFTLQEKAIELKEVQLKQPAVRKKGDTIAYDVTNFKDIQDRTIADVIKKMPGIEIESSGRILYQGEPINKYYIEGMDLLGGKYALANENLSADAVDKVQILENHQPIKMLDSLVISSKAALNIKLKNKITYSGKAEIGLGVSPLLYQTNITPMLFKKKQQMIGSYQSNNRGEDVTKQMDILSLEDLLNNTERFSNEGWLGISSVQTPHFNEKRWLDNAVQLGTWNHLFKLNKELDLRFNLSYTNDYQKRIGQSTKQYFLPSGNLLLNEQKRNHLQSENLSAKATLLRNSTDNYLQNEIEFRGAWNRSHGYLKRDDELVDQILQKPNQEFANQFKIIKKIGKQLVTIRSSISYKDYQEELSISPGVFIDMINQNQNYQNAFQRIDFNKFSTNNFIEFSKGIQSISVHSKIGFGYLNQTMESNLYADEMRIGNHFTNDVNWSIFNYYWDNRFEYRKGNFRTTLLLPIEMNHLQMKNLVKNEEMNRLFVNPNLFLSYKLSNQWELRSTNTYKQSLGSLSQIHENYILYNYNTIQQRDGKLNERNSWISSIKAEYKNPIKARFINLGYNYSWIENTLLNNYQYNSDASSILQVVEQTNHQLSHNLNAKFSQYFSKLKSTFEVEIFQQWSKNDEYLNNEFIEVNNQITNIKTGVKFRQLSWMTFEYNYSWFNYRSKIMVDPSRKIVNQEHQLGFHFFPADRHYIKLNMDAYINDDSTLNPNSFFGDLMYRYTLKKKKIDFELTAYNLFNEKYFSQNSLSSYYEMRYQYKLRPTQIMLTTRFTF
ncbi:carboxypeptidase-like regulatory domain-containing protein [Faecalibacter macacae]|uniref:carboxypeptidase-like regulatory domain-containing protein n=1 Tax=Faecalibacter macacae TaxID=1859289 RepID=UPI001E3A1487|nr:carboxypeptidase regulatory-like domain-containing protein [Faecalibacter macacae]